MSRILKVAKQAVRAAPSANIEAFTTTRQFSSASGFEYKLPDLPYAYDGLEPILPAHLMEIHHSKHHATYVNNLNATLQKRQDAFDKGDIEAVVGFDGLIKFNAGGHINHSIFWTNLAPQKDGGGVSPSGPLLNAINDKFGSLEKFQEIFNAKTAAVQGSGWGWLVYSAEEKGIRIQTTQNQDLVASLGVVPLLTIDVWEHAYYLEYENRRPDFLKSIWQVVNWKNVEQRYANALK
eukprot:UN00139